MSYLGLTPSESSSGEKQSKGSICKTGNRRVRRLLNETAWHFRHSNIVGKALRNRRKGQPDWAIHIAEKAELRLRKRYHRLVNNGKMPCKAVIAVARELSGFIWAMLNQYEIRKASYKDTFITPPPKPQHYNVRNKKWRRYEKAICG